MKLFALLVGALLLGGCSAPDASSPPPAPAASATPRLEPAPAAVSIPKLGARSDLLVLGLNGDGSLQTPPVETPMAAGWYAGADINADGDETKPGQRGSAVIAAHVDGVVDGQQGQPGLFFRLHELAPGDEVLVDQAGGGQLRFLVQSVERLPKAEFPGERVYRAADLRRLNLVTCGGVFDRAAGHYVDNLVVFTTLAPM